MPDTRTERMGQIATDLESEGFYTSANSVRAITEERDRLMHIEDLETIWQWAVRRIRKWRKR
jgi:hypothetical protein